MEYKSFSAEAKADVDNRILKGHAAVTDKVDTGLDMIASESFKRTLKARFRPPNSEKSNKVRALWQHDKKTPIGVPKVLREDSQGLYFEVEATKGVQAADEALALAHHGAVNQSSIGFDPLKTDFENKEVNGENERVRVISDLKLYELSPVTFAQNESATVAASQNAMYAVKSLENINRELKEGRIISKSNMKSIASAISRQRDALDELKGLLSEAIDGIDGLSESDLFDDEDSEGDEKDEELDIDYKALENELEELDNFIQSKTES